MDPIPPSEAFAGIRKILVMKLKHIGDVLLATPCLRALHETFPHARLSMLVDEGTESVIQHHPLLDEVILFPRREMKGLSPGRIAREWKFASGLRRRRFDMTVDLTSADRPAWLAWFSGARYRLAYNMGKGFAGKRLLYTHAAPWPADPDIHEVKKNLGVLERFGITAPAPKLEMHFTEADDRVVREALASFGLQQADGGSPHFVVAHPTSRWLFKCWEDERFAALLDWIQKEHRLPVIVTCGPDARELDRVGKVLAACKVKPRTLLGHLSLTQWAALVKRARLFVGVDSAPMHIAASQGIPSLAFFGPTGFQNWRPWAIPSEVLVKDCPCSRDRREHCDWTRTRACMAAITLDEAKDATVKLLRS